LLTDNGSIDSFLLDNFEEISAEQLPEANKVDTDTEDYTEQTDDNEDMPTMRIHDRTISEESRQSKISNRMMAPSQSK
jgi:hypothetical protein